jgi:hypothetical protein
MHVGNTLFLTHHVHPSASIRHSRLTLLGSLSRQICGPHVVAGFGRGVGYRLGGVDEVLFSCGCGLAKPHE